MEINLIDERGKELNIKYKDIICLINESDPCFYITIFTIKNEKHTIVSKTRDASKEDYIFNTETMNKIWHDLKKHFGEEDYRTIINIDNVDFYYYDKEQDNNCFNVAGWDECFLYESDFNNKINKIKNKYDFTFEDEEHLIYIKNIDSFKYESIKSFGRLENIFYYNDFNLSCLSLENNLLEKINKFKKINNNIREF